jgi:pimeloyl-ACP methyl ester carboxylesterase
MSADRHDRYLTDFPFETRSMAGPHGPIAYFDAGRGPPLLFVHGLAGDYTHFEHVLPDFAEDHRVIGLDLPGCGRSCRPAAPQSVRTYVDSVLALLTHLGLEGATLVGHSCGGLVAAEVALRAPARVPRLVLVDSAGMLQYRTPLRLAGRALLRPWFLTPTLERLAPSLLERIFHQNNAYTRRFVQAALARPRHPTIPDTIRVFEDLAADLLEARVAEEASRLAMPTLVVWGEHDRLVPIREVSAVVARMPRAQLAVMSACGHMPMIEDPAGFIALLRSFLTTARAGKVPA